MNPRLIAVYVLLAGDDPPVALPATWHTAPAALVVGSLLVAGAVRVPTAAAGAVCVSNQGHIYAR